MSDGSRFRGLAVFEAAGAHTMYLHERGVLELSHGPRIEAWRDWCWELGEDDTIAIRYAAAAGGDLYHRLRLQRVGDCWCATASHLCGSDWYRGGYIIGDERICVFQDIKGPAKDYRMFSVMRPLLNEG